MPDINYPAVLIYKGARAKAEINFTIRGVRGGRYLTETSVEGKGAYVKCEIQVRE